jgi:predicted Zn-dependent protease
MPAPSRLDAIRKIMESTPADPFPRYGYAMELKNLGQLEEAHAAFEELERRHPDYVAQYLMHQAVLVSLRRKPEAKAVCERGLEAARRKGDGHAQGEIQQALEAIEYGDE